MKRICEPELMEDPAQARAYAAADFSRTDGAMVEGLLARHGPHLGRRILDLGCGPGNITLRLADLCPEAAVVGVDGSAAMLALAESRRQQRARRGASPSSLAFVQECLPCPSLPDGSFSALVSNSLLHHLHDPGVLWQTVARLGAPGAVVAVQDLRRPGEESECQRLVRQHGAALHPLVRADYLHSLRAAFSPEEVEDQLLRAGLEGLAVQCVDDQYLRVEGRLPGRLIR
jgi:ubiquinone/menaquinone biosynthesis C-methylase UbiE